MNLLDNNEYFEEIRVPKERIAVLIGKNGSTKKTLEKDTNSKIDVDSKEGFVKISSKDALKLIQLRDIIKSISRGFNPDLSRLLLKTDYVLEVINITEFTNTTKGKIRLKGRIIGEEGKARENLERLTETYISVYGKTISIIGEIEHVSICKRAIISLLEGSPHSKVYSWLEKKRKDSKYENVIKQYSPEIDPEEIKDLKEDEKELIKHNE